MAGLVLLRALRTHHSLRLAVAPGRSPASQSDLPPLSCALSPAWRSPPAREMQLCSALCAGHNKWSKVRHIKGPKDEARSRIFTKLGLMIRLAVKEGGPNPNLNSNLAQLVEQCRSKNMPKATIEGAIKSAEKAKPASHHMFEARGPGGCCLLIEVLTDNSTRTTQEVKRLLNNNGGMLSEGAHHNFSRRGLVVVPGQNVTVERALELAIEAGAEDVQQTEDEEEKPILQFVCNMTDLKKVRTSLEELGMEIASAGLAFVPCNHSSLNQDQLDAASTLIEALNDFPDVVHVWDNIQADS
ncbi:translational activator of cytochrome c oxidase 1 [Pholidichthys leucotaenia]